MSAFEIIVLTAKTVSGKTYVITDNVQISSEYDDGSKYTLYSVDGDDYTFIKSSASPLILDEFIPWNN